MPLLLLLLLLLCMLVLLHAFERLPIHLSESARPCLFVLFCLFCFLLGLFHPEVSSAALLLREHLYSFLFLFLLFVSTGLALSSLWLLCFMFLSLLDLFILLFFICLSWFFFVLD